MLTGRFVALEPLAPAHHEALRQAGADPALWEYVPRDTRDGIQPMLDWHQAQAQAGLQVPFAVRRLSNQLLVGITCFLNIVPADGRVEIGATWYQREAQGRPVNPEAKYLLLTHAFAAGFNRVELKIDSRNARSRAAILKLGAREEGVFRQHVWVAPSQTRPGYLRDTVYFSILSSEWPAVRARLEHRLADFSHDRT